MQKWEYQDVALERFIVGGLEVNCYLLVTGEEAILIDPGHESDELRDRVESLSNVRSRHVLLTHGHFDHTGFCPELKDRGWKVCLHSGDEFLLNRVPVDFSELGYRDNPFEPYISLKEGWSFNVGSVALNVVHTPGHSPGSVCFVDHRKRFVFTGDTMFADSIGRTDLTGGNYEIIMTSLKKLATLLEPETLVLSGHGGRAKFSVVKKINRYLKET